MRQIYAELPFAAYNMEAKLNRTHPYFYYLTTKKLMELINQEAKEHVSPELHGQFDLMRDTCNTWQRLAKALSHFRLATPSKECIFKRLVGMKLLELDKRSVLYVVNRRKRFNVEIFLHKKLNAKA